MQKTKESKPPVETLLVKVSAEAPEAPKPPLKTYLVKFGIATCGIDTTRENFELMLVEAPNLTAATESAWFFKGFDYGEEDDQGKWFTWDGKLCFRIKPDACDVDAGSVYWIDEITELPNEDAIVLGKYLP